MTVVVAVVAAAGDKAKKKDSNMKNTMFDSYSFVVTTISTTKKRLNYVILFQTKLMLHRLDLCSHYWVTFKIPAFPFQLVWLHADLMIA